MSRGTGDGQYLGSAVILKEIKINFEITRRNFEQVQAINIGGRNSGTYRMWLVWDHQPKPDGVIPSFTTIFKHARLNTYKNDVNEKRFTIIKEWNGVIQDNYTCSETIIEVAGVEVSTILYSCGIKKDWRSYSFDLSKRVRYKSDNEPNVGNTDELRDGNLMLWGISDQDNLIDIKTNSRIGFIDD